MVFSSHKIVEAVAQPRLMISEEQYDSILVYIAEVIDQAFQSLIADTNKIEVLLCDIILDRFRGYPQTVIYDPAASLISSVILDGNIEEEGTHEELLEKNGAYAELFEIQSRYYQEGREF